MTMFAGRSTARFVEIHDESDNDATKRLEDRIRQTRHSLIQVMPAVRAGTVRPALCAGLAASTLRQSSYWRPTLAIACSALDAG